MIHKIKSIGALDMLTDWDAFLDDKDNPSVQPPTELEIVQTGESAPVEGGMVRKEDYLIITALAQGADHQTQYDELRMAADSLNGQSVTIVGLDEKKKEWFVMGRVAGHTMKKGISKLIMQVADSVWQANETISQTWTVTASGQELPIEVGGTVEALPIFGFTPKDAKAGGFAYRAWIRLYNPNSEAVLNEKVDITNGGWDTAALTTAKMQSGGQDLRVYDKDVEVDRELTGMDTASTKVFAGPFNFAPKIEMTLDANIANTGVPAYILVKNTKTDIAFLTKLPNERGIIEVDNERMIYNGRDVKSRKIYIEARPVRGSTIASHTAGAVIKWIEHDPWVYYGNSTIDAPEADPIKAAAFVIASSTNANRDYTSFGDKAGLRPGSWKLNILSRTAGSTSTVYSGTGGDETADPITVLGMLIRTFIKSAKPVGVTAQLEAKFSHPGGITSITPSVGTKKRTTASWPAFVGLQKSIDGVKWANVNNEATPSVLGSFVTIVNTALQAIGSTYKHVRFLLSGSLTATRDAEAYFEIDGATVVIANPITAAMMAEEDNYDLDCEMQNTYTYQGETVTESFFLKKTMGLDETLTFNTKARTIVHSDGSNAFNALQKLDVERLEFLSFKPGVTNTLKFIDAGTSEMNISVSYVERRKR